MGKQMSNINAEIQNQPRQPPPQPKTVPPASKRFEDYVKDLRNADPKIRISAILGIQRSHDPRSVPEITRMLIDGEVMVKVTAITALGYINDKSAAPALIAALKSDPTVTVKAESARVLGTLVAASAIPELKAALSSPAFEVRKEAVAALGRINDPTTKGDVKKMFSDADPRIRASAVWALGEMGGKLDIPGLIRLRIVDAEPSVKAEADSAIAKLLQK